MLSSEQALYIREYLTLKNTGNEVSRIGTSLFDSKITLNPHQINAALSFFKNPLLKGIIFADEVGLGKTIEAGIVISQYWYEHKRKILIVAPASLMKQWNEELYDKFLLQSTILDSKTINDFNIYSNENIFITSINMVYLHKDRFINNYDLIVIDEAHKLRNVYKEDGVMAVTIKEIFRDQKKLLLTATPFQNNLMELYGLMSLIDEDILGDTKFFKEKYINNYSVNKENLKEILTKYIIRTLRKNVTKYINYTKRQVIISDYYVTKEESELYEKITNLMYSSDFSENYTTGQNQLIILLLQKLLSSSIHAVTSTLNKMKQNLVIDESELFLDIDEQTSMPINLTKVEKGLINNIESCLDFASNIAVDSKYNRLIEQLDMTFEHFSKNSSKNKKILIFTESKQTQMYLYNKLKNTEKYNNVIYFNGDNSLTKDNLYIYKEWENKNTNASLNKTANIRKAIIDAFENKFDILIATDAAAEGLNMQFCSVIINYDLPWNPQKIEQRIGRCHRYGQKNDVIIINMLNRSNSIDQRIYELLNYKLGIFEETFGSSDLILGTSNISNDMEKAIKEVYKKCRNPKEIEQEFIKLQSEFQTEIEETIKNSESQLEKYFDEEVVNAFDLQYIEATKIVNEYEDLFELLIMYLYPNISIENHIFKYKNNMYTTSNKNNEYVFCSLNNDFGIETMKKAETIVPNNECIDFYYSKSNQKIGYIDNLSCKKGKIIVSKIIYDSFEVNEALVITAKTLDGEQIPQDIIHKLMKCCGKNNSNTYQIDDIYLINNENIKRKIKEIENKNKIIFDDELKYIDNWADNAIEKIEMDVKILRDMKHDLQVKYSLSDNINEKTNIQEEINKISKKISKLWIKLAKEEDEVEERRTTLINNLKAEKEKKIETKTLFEVSFNII